IPRSIEGLERYRVKIRPQDVPVEKTYRLPVRGMLADQFHIHMRLQVVDEQFTGRCRSFRNKEINPAEVESIRLIEMHVRKIDTDAVATEEVVEAAVDLMGIHQS